MKNLNAKNLVLIILYLLRNKEKLSLKFNPNSDLIINHIDLYNVIEERTDVKINKVLKYFVKDKNLDIDIIFNKKRKYKIKIYYLDFSLFDGTKESIKFNYINYYEVLNLIQINIKNLLMKKY